MIPIQTYLTIILLSGSFDKTIQQDIFCDKTKNLTIDSVLVKYKDNLKLSFFIDNDIYELEPIDRVLKFVKVIKRFNLTDLSPTIEPPINLAFFTNSYESKFRLYNVKKPLYFEFFKNRTINPNFIPKVSSEQSNRRIFDSVVLNKDMDGLKYGLRFLFYWFNKERNETGIKFMSFEANTTHKYWLMTRQFGSVKQIKIINETAPEAYNLTNKVFYQFNGQNITAAFVYHHYWYIFSGRQFCKMNISVDQWLDFCQIRDISNFFIDCQTTSETTIATKSTAIATTRSITTRSTTTRSTTTPPTTTRSTTTRPTKTRSTGTRSKKAELRTTQAFDIFWMSTSGDASKKKDQMIIIIAICCAIIVLFSWIIIFLVIYIVYKYTRNVRDMKYASGRTSASSNFVSQLSSVKTIDSNGNTDNTGKTKV